MVKGKLSELESSNGHPSMKGRIKTMQMFALRSLHPFLLRFRVRGIRGRAGSNWYSFMMICPENACSSLYPTSESPSSSRSLNLIFRHPGIPFYKPIFRYIVIVLLTPMGKIIENYNLQELLGQGVYGKVYKGINLKTKQEVAIKVIKADKFTQIPKLEECTINEIKILSSIESNPHVVRYLDMLKTINNFYFVYEYCNGGTLEKMMASYRQTPEKVMPLQKTIIFFGQILDAFKTLTKHNIMHRDLKPDNILIHNGAIKIADFGFSKMLKSPTDLAQTMLGSPIYMAPQVIKGEIYTMKADIWSLGVVLYQMVFGYCPFQSKSIAKLIQILQSDEVKFPWKVPQAIQNVLRKMLVKDPSKRIDWTELFQYRITESGELIEPNNSSSKLKSLTVGGPYRQNSINLVSPSNIRTNSGQYSANQYRNDTSYSESSNNTSTTTAGSSYKYLNTPQTATQFPRKSPYGRQPELKMPDTGYKYTTGTFVDSQSQLSQLIKNHKKISYITKLAVDVLSKFPKESVFLSYILSKAAQKQLNDILDSLNKDWASQKNLRMDKAQQESIKLFKQTVLEQTLDLETLLKMLKEDIESTEGDISLIMNRRNRYLRQFVKAYTPYFDQDEEAIVMVFQLLDFFEESILLKADAYKRLTKEQLLKQINAKLEKLN